MYPWPCYNDLLYKDCSVKGYVINSMEFHNDQQTGLCRTSLDTAAKESSQWGRGGIPLLVIQHGEAAVQKLKTCFKGSCDQMFPFSVLCCPGQILTMLFLQRHQVNNCRVKQQSPWVLQASMDMGRSKVFSLYMLYAALFTTLLHGSVRNCKRGLG